MKPVVVLGCRLSSPEIRPELRGRMDVAIDLFERTDADRLVVCGGWTNPDVPLTEAEVMARYAIENGIDPDDVLLEEQSRDTIGNAYFARRLLDGADVSTLHVVSSCYHADRSAYLFEQCFGDGFEVRADHCYQVPDHGMAASEREKLDYAREFFEPVSAGNVAELRDRLVEAHPLYDDSLARVPALGSR